MRHVVIMPAHNEAAYVGDALTSLLNQTLPPDRIIVVDNGSDDETAAIVRRIAATSPTVHLVGDAPPKGRRYRVVDVFERGYRLVAGTPFDYVSKLDADQLFPPDYFERLLGFMDGEPRVAAASGVRSEEHTSELQSLMRISYAVFCLKKKK